MTLSGPPRLPLKFSCLAWTWEGQLQGRVPWLQSAQLMWSPPLACYPKPMLEKMPLHGSSRSQEHAQQSEQKHRSRVAGPAVPEPLSN